MRPWVTLNPKYIFQNHHNMDPSLYHFKNLWFLRQNGIGPTINPRGGALTVWWYTGMSRVLGVTFLIFRIGLLIGGFRFQTQCAQFAKLGVFRKFWPKKAPDLSKIWWFLRQNGIEMGPQITLFEVYLWSKSRSPCVAHPRQLWIWEPPPPDIKGIGTDSPGGIGTDTNNMFLTHYSIETH